MKHFITQELVDQKTYEKMGEDALSLFHPNILIALDDLRSFFNASISINDWFLGGKSQWRGYRPTDCPIGAKNSQHRKGNAFDCTVKGRSAEEARVEILAHQDNELLIHIMRMEDKVSWLHIDGGTPPPGKSRIYLFQP